ncbi:MAG: Gfo/Idh/MocA family oxidoreductase [Planctomycetota bacterium]
MKISTTRRDFLATSAAAAATCALGVGGARRASAAGSDDEIRLAVVGLNGRGNSHLKIHHEAPGVRVVAVCDVDAKVLEATAAKYSKTFGYRLDAVADYDELLARTDIDAVSLATPNHWHALQTIRALDAGKHVYVEKPVCHNVWEGEQMLAAEARSEGIVIVGFQNRHMPAMIEAVDFVRSGQLGAIKTVRTTCDRNRAGIGRSDTPVAPPASLNYNAWLGPADDLPIYRPRYHYDWHWDVNTGNGDLGNQSPHELDIARMFLGDPGHPTSVLSFGNRLGWDDAGNTCNMQGTLFTFADGARLISEVRNLVKGDGAKAGSAPGVPGVGVAVECEGGTVLASRGQGAKILDREGLTVRKIRGGDRSRDVATNFAEAIRAGDRSLVHTKLSSGFGSSCLAHFGNAAVRVGAMIGPEELAEVTADRPLLAEVATRYNTQLRAMGIETGADTWRWSGAYTLGEEAGRFDSGGDVAAANALLVRRGRAPYEIPELVS